MDFVVSSHNLFAVISDKISPKTTNIQFSKEELIKFYQDFLDNLNRRYSFYLGDIFASERNLFSNSEFKMELSTPNFLVSNDEDMTTSGYDLIMNWDGTLLNISSTKTLNSISTERHINHLLILFLYHKTLSVPYICSVERTGISLFRQLLDNSALDSRSLFSEQKPVFARPIEQERSFLRTLETKIGSKSWLLENHPDILEDFKTIAEGEYKLTNSALLYQPENSAHFFLLREASSCARSLVSLYFFLIYEANENSILIIDEPELNLHPKKQRQLARLLVRLVNVGIKVFITTHSDFFIREFNTLSLLDANKEQSAQIIKDYQFKSKELLPSEKITIYETQKDEENDGYTLAKVPKDQWGGFNLSSFNQEIEEMNQIDDEILTLLDEVSDEDQ